MGVLLASERQTAKGRIFLAIVYAVLALGGLTMVLPFLIMLASSISGPYDYNRHAPVVRAIWDRDDRFMRSLATYFPRFPREIYPDAPESWGSWTTVARDTDGIAAFAAQHLEPAWTNLDVRAEWKRRAEAFRDRTLAWDIDYTTCSYDARDVAPFVKSQTSLDELNRTWPVRYRSFFDISFTAESKIPLGHASWKPPKDDPKYAMWCAFKDHYRQRMVADGDYICRTLPFPLTGGSRSCATETGGARSCATATDVKNAADAYVALGRAFADLLALHTDYSLYESCQRLDAVEKIRNPDFEHVLYDNASCGYCRSHQYEVARWWAVPAMTDLANMLAERAAAGDKSPIPPLNQDRYRERSLHRPLAEMRPMLPRTPENWRRVMGELARCAEKIVSLR